MTARMPPQQRKIGTRISTQQENIMKLDILKDSLTDCAVTFTRDGEGSVWGVMDLDSPLKHRFTPEDQLGLEAFARAIESTVQWE